ncbi:MAG TPA: amidohydrolase family protein [Chloroflexota bacterium]|nr:amidohydrolase family protein [Chloroflexota bacterium]
MPENAWPNDIFIVDTEAHPLGEYREDIGYFPPLARSQRHMIRSRVQEHGSAHRARHSPDMAWGDDVGDACVHDMDLGGVDIAWCSRHDLRDSAGGYPVSTNGQMFELCQKHPDRLFFTANLGQVVKRGLKDSLWELDYWVKEQGCRIIKYYCPDDVPINDERLWPFWARCQELDVIVCMHIGPSFTIPQQSLNGHPLHLEEVCNAFPDMRIVAYHLGRMWYRECILMMQKYDNLYGTISAWIDSLLVRAPWQAHQIIGEALREGLEDKLMWGSEWGRKTHAVGIPAVLDFSGMPDDMARGWGAPPITMEFKRKLLGLNAAKLLGIELVKRAKPAGEMVTA